MDIIIIKQPEEGHDLYEGGGQTFQPQKGEVKCQRSATLTRLTRVKRQDVSIQKIY